MKNKKLNGNVEKRFINLDDLIELRIVKRNDEDPIIEGYAALFNNWSEDLGGFRERIKPGAFKKALKSSDTRMLFNHDSNFVLGRKSADTLEMKENSVGLRVKNTPPDTQWAKDLLVSIARKDISGMSFGFVVEKDEWKEDSEGRVERTILEFRELLDVSPVTFPAYPDTQVALRRLDEFREESKTNQPDGEITESEQEDEDAVIGKLGILKRQNELKKKSLILED